MMNPPGTKGWSAVVSKLKPAKAGSSVFGPIGGGVRFVPPICYKYAFVSDRERNVENIFFGDTCSPAVSQATPNTVNHIHFSSLTASPLNYAVAAVEVDTFDPRHPKAYLSVYNDRGGGSLPYYGFRDRFIPHSPAWGPYDQFALVTTDLSWRNPVIRTAHPFGTTMHLEPRIVVEDDPDDTRTFGRISWIPERDTARTGYGKIVVSLTSGISAAGRDYTARLFILDSATGGLSPLKDASDSRGRDQAMPGKEPAASADGRRLAFIRNVSGLDWLWTCDLTLTPADGEGGGYNCENVRMMTTAIHEPESREGNYAWPCWSYDSKKIFFSFDAHWTATNDRYRNIYMVNPDGSSLQRLGEGENDNFYPACLPLVQEFTPRPVEATFMPIRETYEAVPAERTVQPATFRVACEKDSDCPSGQVCRDNTCRAP